MIGDIGLGAGAGAMSGAAFGPVGIGAGAVLGGISGYFNARSRKKAKRAAEARLRQRLNLIDDSARYQERGVEEFQRNAVADADQSSIERGLYNTSIATGNRTGAMAAGTRMRNDIYANAARAKEGVVGDVVDVGPNNDAIAGYIGSIGEAFGEGLARRPEQNFTSRLDGAGTQDFVRIPVDEMLDPGTRAIRRDNSNRRALAKRKPKRDYYAYDSGAM